MQSSANKTKSLRIEAALGGGSAGEEKGVDVCQTSGRIEKD